jgi:predicted RNA-binding Zn-ribbon protein involved in translation (DUF1610 family)
MIDTLMVSLIRAMIRIIPSIERWYRMATNQSIWIEYRDGTESINYYEYKGIKFRYFRMDDYISMERPSYSFLCPKCGSAMNYRRFGKYRCENPDCRHKAKTRIWGEWKFYDFIRRRIKRELGII